MEPLAIATTALLYPSAAILPHTLQVLLSVQIRSISYVPSDAFLLQCCLKGRNRAYGKKSQQVVDFPALINCYIR
jgi:hypothetical protein